jgi:hypothetical protein
VLCGPLAEKGWDELRPGTLVTVQTNGPDAEAIRLLDLNSHGRSACLREALTFIAKPEVQAQIDRVTEALLEHATMTADEVRAASRLSGRLCSSDWM